MGTAAHPSAPAGAAGGFGQSWRAGHRRLLPPWRLSRQAACTATLPTRWWRRYCRWPRPAAFLENEAAFTLRSSRESSRNRPFWLRGTDVVIERAPLGVVLVIGAGNYPLFLAGAQVLQALAAGNAVLWKPAHTGVACAHAVRAMLIASGLHVPSCWCVLNASPAAAQAAIEAGVDKVFLTGSAATGEAVQHALAATATPSVMELSGCDAGVCSGRRESCACGGRADFRVAPQRLCDMHGAAQSLCG